ncbi:MAG: Mur ligase family protein [Firmicutes bacterium]|nr:Mur ligase family protein [Bacillota bacterium]MCL5039187.1 Mur ligase family protein [Bacillota bacterium]
MDLQGLVAIWVGKVTILASRLLGKGGSTFPGRVARRIDPDLLRKLAHLPKQGNVMVSGTNGKTTTARMISSILEAAGLKVVHNRAGANLLVGITAAFLAKASWWGSLEADLGLVEVDEATVPAAARELAPRLAVVTNFFRDQLDRYGELEHTFSFIREGLELLPAEGNAILNADDPLVASLVEFSPAQVTFYGLEDASLASQEEETRDVRFCRHCGERLDYGQTYYAHLGWYRCPGCGFRRPDLDYAVRQTIRGSRGSRLEILTPRGELEAEISVPGVYNIYNALAAVATTMSLGISREVVAKGLQAFVTSFGRMEHLLIRNREVFLALVKNPTGFNAVIKTLLEGEERKNVLIAINDKYADGTDISWLWDVDFERLATAEERVNFILTSGIRAEDMAVRLKYAGFPVEKLAMQNDLGSALEEGLTRAGEGGTLYILPTYTALLEIREVINKLGYGRRFWQE